MRLILLLLAFVTSTVTSVAQNDFEIIEKLDKAGLLTSYEKESIIAFSKEREKHRKKMLKDPDVYIDTFSYKVASYPLDILQDAKAYSTVGTRHVFGFTPASVQIPESKEQEVIAGLSAYAKKIFAAKLVSGKTYAELLERIRSLKSKSEFEVTEYATYATNEEYFLLPEFFKAFADSLLIKDIISKDSYTELMKKSEAGELMRYDEYYKHLKNSVVIDLSEYSWKPEEYLEAIHRKTASALPGLSFDKFSYSIDLNKRESFKDFEYYDLAVTIQQGGKTYKHASFYDLKGPRELPKTHGDKIDHTTYYQIFNKILAENESPYRLHVFNYGETSFGVIALTKSQSRGLEWRYDGMIRPFLDFHRENFTNKVNQNKMAEAVAMYDSIGLFGHLSIKEKDSCIQSLPAKEIYHYNDILSSIKGLVFEVDLEYGVDDGQYKKITEKIAEFSRGHFKPEQIIDGYKFRRVKKNVFDYGFTLNGKRYLVKLEQNDDWLDPAFWDLIDKAVKTEDKTGAFYYLHPADGLRVIYLTNEQANILKQKKMIELEEADLEED